MFSYEGQICLAPGSKNPLGRPGTPEEVGNLAVYLTSKENSYIAGQDIVIEVEIGFRK